MRKWPQRLAGLLAAAVFAVLASARAETCQLALKRLEPMSRTQMFMGSQPEDVLFRMTNPQHLFMQFGVGMVTDMTKAFPKVVKKEPEKYESERPFRGVAKLGSQQFGFVLDAQPAKAESESSKSDAKESKPEGYGRLLFDYNHNGDLTDDKVVEANPPPQGILSMGMPAGYSHREFPRIDVSIEVDGAKTDYSFFLTVVSQSSGGFSYATAMFNAAAYREGQITLGGKSRRVVLLDNNSNGRFDDKFGVFRSDSGGDLSPVPGDVLLIDPQTGKQANPLLQMALGMDGDENRHHVSKLVNVDGRFHELKVSATGDQLTLTPSSVPLGKLANNNKGFRAVLFSDDQGFVKLTGGQSEPVSVPAGEWNLLSYTIDRTGYEPAEKPEKERSLLETLTDALMGGASAANAMPRYTFVSARATGECKPVTVRQGKTTAMPFGPPYKPVVKVAFVQGDGQVQLALSLVGAAGEVCSGLQVDGKQPPPPEFTITGPDGKEVESGKFEYG